MGAEYLEADRRDPVECNSQKTRERTTVSDRVRTVGRLRNFSPLLGLRSTDTRRWNRYPPRRSRKIDKMLGEPSEEFKTPRTWDAQACKPTGTNVPRRKKPRFHRVLALPITWPSRGVAGEEARNRPPEGGGRI